MPGSTSTSISASAAPHNNHSMGDQHERRIRILVSANDPLCSEVCTSGAKGAALPNDTPSGTRREPPNVIRLVHRLIEAACMHYVSLKTSSMHFP